ITREPPANPMTRPKSPKPHRPPRRQPGSYAPPDAQDEPGEAWGRPRDYFSPDPKIRKGHEPDRGKPTATHLPNPSGPGGILLRGSAGSTGSAHPKKRRLAGRRHGFHGHLGRVGTGQCFHEDC